MKPFKTLGLLLSVISIVYLVLPVSNSIAADRIAFKNEGFSFGPLPHGWSKEKSRQKFHMFYAVNDKYGAKIWLTHIPKGGKVNEGPDSSLKDVTMRWFDFVSKKAGWKNVEFMDQKFTQLNGQEAYVVNEKHIWKKNGAHVKQKVYFVRINGEVYKFQMVSLAKKFSYAVIQFDQWMNSFEAI